VGLHRVLLLAAVVLAAVWPLSGQTARADTAEETPDVEGFLETRTYTGAATREVLGQWAYVVGEVDNYPGNPSPQESKKSQLRKRLLDLRLLMDYNWFAYKSGNLDRYRDLVDVAYETVGQFKDLFDIYVTFNIPFDDGLHDGRLNDMQNAVAPFRQADVRKKFEKAVDGYEANIVSLDGDQRPRIWQIADITPDNGLDSAGNAAHLCQAMLYNLRSRGLLVDDIYDPNQEAQFHDVRKALRSALVLTDMFPSLTEAVAGARKPLDDLVSDYGKANDQVVAYHAAVAAGLPLDERTAALNKAFAKVQKEADDFANSGQLDAFAEALGGAQIAHQR
jgi:hypothetical protein